MGRSSTENVSGNLVALLIICSIINLRINIIYRVLSNDTLVYNIHVKIDDLNDIILQSHRVKNKKIFVGHLTNPDVLQVTTMNEQSFKNFNSEPFEWDQIADVYGYLLLDSSIEIAEALELVHAFRYYILEAEANSITLENVAIQLGRLMNTRHRNIVRRYFEDTLIAGISEEESEMRDFVTNHNVLDASIRYQALFMGPGDYPDWDEQVGIILMRENPFSRDYVNELMEEFKEDLHQTWNHGRLPEDGATTIKKLADKKTAGPLPIDESYKPHEDIDIAEGDFSNSPNNGPTEGSDEEPTDEPYDFWLVRIRSELFDRFNIPLLDFDTWIETFGLDIRKLQALPFDSALSTIRSHFPD